MTTASTGQFPRVRLSLTRSATERRCTPLVDITTASTGQFPRMRLSLTRSATERRCTARLAFSIAHVSVRPPCHHGRSHFASPVGDHDCPCAIFPASSWLKRSLAYTPCATGLPRSSIAACRPDLAGAESGMSGTSSTRHDREPLRTFEVLPLG
jgi:hypothetical protein